MPDAFQTTVLNFQGGFATDLAPQVRQLSFLSIAQDVFYDVSGAVKKAGGTAKVNSTALSGGPDVLGLYDFWFSGTGGSSTQRFVATTSDGKVYSENPAGTFNDVTGAASIGANAIPVFAQMRDLLTFWWSDGSTPLKWNQTGNVASLGGSPPAGRGAVFHINRGWLFNRNSNPSRIYYSSSTDVEDWTGGDTGSIDIDPEDGDRIIGAVSYKEVLVVFKGPYRGSIHLISGTDPDTFARTVLVRGLPLQTHNSILSNLDDVWFMSDRGIHSLAATQKFGNFEGADLTRYLKTYFRQQVNRTNLSKVCAVDYAHKGCALWGITPSGQSENTTVFGISYIRAQEEGLKPFIWNRACLSAATRINSSNVKEVVFGSSDGFVLRQDQPDRVLAGGTGYTFRVRTPSVILGGTDSQGKAKGEQPVSLGGMYMKSRPVGDYDITVNVYRDDNTLEAYTFNQGAAGFVLDVDQLDVGKLGGGNLITKWSNPPLVGRARSVMFDMQQGGANQDVDVYELGILHTPAAEVRSDTL